MKRAPGGFSLNDMLAIPLVAGVGLMIWLAFVQSARETSRRTLCVNNLKQIGEALQQYEATHGSFPLGVTASFNPMSQANNAGVVSSGVPTGVERLEPACTDVGLSRRNASLSFDQFRLRSCCEWAGAVQHDGYSRESRPVPLFHRPVRGQSEHQQLLRKYWHQRAGYRPPDDRGVWLSTTLPCADVTDGLSNTVAFAEGLSGNWKSTRYRGNGVVNYGTPFPDPNIATAERFPDQVLANLQACNGGFSGPRSGPSAISGNRGQSWAWGAEAMSLFNTIVPPNSTEYVFNHCRYICGACFLLDADHSDIVNASSYHPGGANAVFCDGGVRFIPRLRWPCAPGGRSARAARATWSSADSF